MAIVSKKPQWRTRDDSICFHHLYCTEKDVYFLILEDPWGNRFCLLMRSWNRNLAKLSRISIPLHEFSSSSQRYLGRGRGSWRLRLHLPRCDHYFSSCCLRMKISSDCRTKLIQQLSLYHASDPWPNNIHRVIYITCTYTYVHIFIYTFVLVCIYNINQLSHAVYYPLPLEKKVFVATQNLLWHFGSR